MTTEAASSGESLRVLKRGRVRLITDAGGGVARDQPASGLYGGDTRFLSTLEVLVDGLRPFPADAAGGVWFSDRDEIRLAAGPGLRLFVQRRRRLNQRFAETIELARAPARTEARVVELRVGFDGADIFEIRGYPRAQRGELLPPQVASATVHFAYLGLDARLRTLDLSVKPVPSRPIAIATAEGGREMVATVTWELGPGSEPSLIGWTICPMEVDVSDRSAASATTASGPIRARARRRVFAPSTAAVEVQVDAPGLQRVLERALSDLELLTEPGPGPDQRLIAAGLPWFDALFGRDSLLTAYEAIAFRPDLATDALSVLAERQAGKSDPRGGAPGQILHELRTGEMARLGEVPFGPSFGSIDATPLFLMLLGEAMDWLDDRTLLDRLWLPALRALAWIETHIATDPDGFLRYTGSPGALANEGWKDSPDSVRDHHGEIVPPPIALAEVQGYVYDAYRRMARLARQRGKARLAADLRGRAARLRARFDAVFWSRQRSFLPMAVGAGGRLADAVSSNAGQCLWTGILSEPRAVLVAGRMLAVDVDSGWGIRTIAESEPAFDPLGYHTGSVWPHDAALIAGGLKRAGFDDGAARIADQLLEAATVLPTNRLPELISGARRRAGRPPELVPDACPIQAWASAAPLHLIRTLLGLEPMAAKGRLGLRRPRLPDTVGAITLRGLAVGRRRFDLEVRRTRTGVQARSLGGRSSIELVRLA